MAKLGTGGFLKSLFVNTLKGDPLAVLDDIQESVKEDKKKDKSAIDVEGEESSDEKA